MLSRAPCLTRNSTRLRGIGSDQYGVLRYLSRQKPVALGFSKFDRTMLGVIGEGVGAAAHQR